VRARLGTTFQSLTVRNFRLFAIGQLIKLHGVWMQFIAQDWLVLELSNNSPSALGIVTALQFAPVLLLTLYGGKLADRHDKRRLLIAANTGFSALALVLGLLVATGNVTLTAVFVVAALMGVANAIETPVRQSFVSDLVPPPLLPNALGLSSAVFNASRIVGPALASLAIWLGEIWGGLGPVFLLNAGLAIAPVYLLSRLDKSRLTRLAMTGARASIRDGLRYIWRSEDLVVPIVVMFVVGLFGFNFQLTLAVLAKNVFNSGPQTFGLLTTALAIGALGGALASSARRSRPSVYKVLGAGVVFSLLETVVGFGPTFWATAAILVPAGFFMIYLAQAANQRIQLGVDPEYRGRVMAVYVLVFLGTTPIGSLLIGYVSEHFGPRVGVWGGGLVSLIASSAALVWQLRRAGAKIRVRVRPRPRFEVVSAVEPTPALVS
jgi:MFS family permease